MQDSHLKKVQKTDILQTLRSFLVGESEFIPFSDSQTDVNTWRARYGILHRTGVIDGVFKFYSSQPGTTVGTLIIRVA